MKSFKLLLIVCIALMFSVPVWWYMSAGEKVREFDENEPDLGAISVKIDKAEYLRLRTEQIDMLRGIDSAKQDSRSKAIRDLERKEAELRNSPNRPEDVRWRFQGPAPIPVGATNSNSGRVSAIAVHPTDPNIVYVGTAFGGLYRSLNGGATWVPIMDDALTLAIGSITIVPSDPTTLYVGTGEATFSGLSFSGVGVYRISNADTTPVLTGPLNKNAGGNDIFTGRSIGRVVVHPTDPNIIFVTSASGISGIGGTNQGMALPNAGVYRSTNAMSANPVFEQLTIQGTLAPSRSVVDAATEPGNPARLLVSVIGSGGDGGVYLTTNALDPTPTFTRTLTTGDGNSPGRTEFAVNKTGSVVTVYAAAGTANGTVFKSTDGGASFTPLTAGVGFCNPQCFYDIAIAVDQGDANKLYLGGSPSRVFGRSIDGGGSYTNSSSGLHVDTQAFAIAPSNPNIVYFGSDGGIWRTNNVQATPIVWQSLNNTTFSATQFMGITLHPIDRNYSLGGTQDNGTEFLASDGATWVRSDGGDGGFAYIDKNSPNTSSVTAYHTYFNQSNTQIGFTRALTTDPNGDPIWSGFLGCQNGSSNNGILCSDTVRFYAPMVGGPGNPNTLYFGTNRLYRSVDRGTTMVDVSGTLPANVTAIGISPQNDDIRLVGLQNGSVFLSTTAGATTMTNVTGTIPARYVGRVAIDPTNANVAYVCLNGYGLPAGQHVWKTTNLLSGTPSWSPAGAGIPDVPVNSFAIDPANTQVIFAGTDIGVFKSDDGGANWIPFSNGLPRVPVFGMEFHPVHRVLRIATHGRGFYEFAFANQRAPFDFDGDSKTDVAIFRPGSAEWWLSRSSNGSVFAAQFGGAGDEITPGDYTGDGKADITVWRPSSGEWFVLRSEDFSFFAFPFGTNGDVPAPADFDADGKMDAAVYRPSNSAWFVRRSGDGGTTIETFGTTGDVPVAADYDGDGKADIAIYRPSLGQWWVKRSASSVIAFTFGESTDKPVQGDYTGDAKSDVAFWRPSTGQWFILRSEDFSFYAVPFGTSGDVPSPGDYDGDGKFDTAIFRPSNSTWYVDRSTAGVLIQQFGTTGDVPVPNAYVP